MRAFKDSTVDMTPPPESSEADAPFLAPALPIRSSKQGLSLGHVATFSPTFASNSASGFASTSVSLSFQFAVASRGVICFLRHFPLNFLRGFVLQTWGFCLCVLDFERFTLSLTSFLGFLMSNSDSSEDKKHVSVPKVVPMMSKITKDKLIVLNYSDWSKTICHYLGSIRLASHLNKDFPKDDSKERWLEDDARLFLQICNSNDDKVLTLIITMSMLIN